MKKLSWILLGAATSIMLANCGQGFVTDNLSSLGQSTSSASNNNSVTFTRAPGQSCEEALLNVYKNTYHSFLVSNCNSCHVTGGAGSGAFAVNDAAASYTVFNSKGVSLINSQSVGGHRPPYTGSHNQSTISEISAYWDKAKIGYQDCVVESGGVADNTYLSKTTSSIIPAPPGETFATMEWDLETQSSSKVPLIAKIEVRKALLGGNIIGYEFRNPTLRLKDNAKTPYLLQGMNLYINDKKQTGITTYSHIEATINTKADIHFALGLASATIVMTPGSDDVIALEFSALKATTGPIVPAPTPTPTPSPTPIGVVTYSSLLSQGGVIMSRCNLCHSGDTNSPMDLFHYESAKALAPKIKIRINDPNNPMPPKGLLPQNERDILNAWVDQGAPR